jgi:DNA-binding IclR family transcriptional regulator
MDNPVADATARRSRGLERAFDILECLREARRPMRPNEIAGAMGAPRSTVYELIGVLLKLEVLEHHGGEGRVFLGRKLFLFGAAYSERSDLFRRCSELLEEIVEETRETAQFCLLDGDKYTVAMMREGSRPFRISTSVGERTPLPWTASGRLLVDHLTDSEILAFIPAEDFRLPSGGWLDPAVYLDEVRRASREGFFTFDSIVDSYTHCFAVPVRRPDGRAAATLCLVAPRSDAAANRDRYLDCLLESADRLRVVFLDRTADRDLARLAGMG